MNAGRRPARAEAYAALSASRPRVPVDGDALEAFGTRFTAQGGTWKRIGSTAEIPSVLADHFGRGSDAVTVLTGGDPILEGIPWSSEPCIAARAAGARPEGPVAITTALAAVAETGSLAVDVHAGAGMALNFLPDRLVVVVRAADVVANLEDLWARVRARFGRSMPRAITLISGPSSTLDVAMTPAVGVHGPLELLALVL
jgi:L-lactate dehydrogenase complex protein LldG